MNKKTVFAIILLIYILLPVSAGAVPVPAVSIGPTNVGSSFVTQTFMGVVQNIANYIIALIAILGIIFILYGATFQAVVSGGDEESVGKGKTTITYGLIGLFIAAMAYALETLVLKTLVG